MRQHYKLVGLLALILLSNTAYGLSCRADCDYFANISLYHGAASPEIISVELDSIFGKCPPDPGVSNPDAYNLQNECYIWENLTNVQARIHNDSTTGCWAQGPLASGTSAAADFIIYSNAGDVIGGCDGPWLELCINGTPTITPWTYNSSTPDYTITLSTSNLTSNYRYNISYWYEENGSLYAIPSGQLVTEFFCTGDREGFPHSYTATAQDNIVITETPVRIVNTIGSSLRRTYITEDGGHKRVWFPGVEYSPYTLTLNDYSGGSYFTNATLSFEKGIQSELEVVENNSFDNDNLLVFYAINGSEYRLKIKSNTGREMNLGFVEFRTTDTDRDVIVNDAVINDFLGNCPTLTASWTSDYATSQVGASVSDTTYDISSFFNVSNASTTTYTHTYSASSAADTVTYSYTLPDRGIPVYLELTIDHPECGRQYFNTLTLLRNESYPLDGAFNPPLPGTLLGAATTTVKALIALGLTALIFYVLCKASDYGTGALVGVGSFAFFWHVNMLPKDNIPLWFIAILLLIAFAVKMFEKRS